MSVFFFRQKTAYGMRISDWSSDVCSSDLLPLKSVYVDVRGVNVPLRRIWRSGVAQNGDRYEQVSFYVIPIQFTKQEGRLLADFTGERRGFGISTFGPTMYDDAAPAFVRLDAYDSPGEPDEASLRKLLVRERSEEKTSELPSIMRITYAV